MVCTCFALKSECNQRYHLQNHLQNPLLAVLGPIGPLVPARNIY